MHTWMIDAFGFSDGLARGLSFAVALGFVLLLIGLFVFILKRLTGTQLPGSRSRHPRIGVMDAANIDGRRRLLLVRRDNIEHLILIGGPTDIVVEQNIIKNAPISRPKIGDVGVPIQASAPGYQNAPDETDMVEPEVELTPRNTAQIGERNTGQKTATPFMGNDRGSNGKNPPPSSRQTASSVAREKLDALTASARARQEAITKKAMSAAKPRNTARLEATGETVALVQGEMVAPAAPEPSISQPIRQPTPIQTRISPPSSGPAARAKSVFQQQGQTAPKATLETQESEGANVTSIDKPGASAAEENPTDLVQENASVESDLKSMPTSEQPSANTQQVTAAPAADTKQETTNDDNPLASEMAKILGEISGNKNK
ncbi:MAG: flagellar biosynthetic protein FliO [Rhodobacteraceae bacterium]|nr:flagellar biosynthetic protein FliO [Paracoccaceae bacterium]